LLTTQHTCCDHALARRACVCVCQQWHASTPSPRPQRHTHTAAATAAPILPPPNTHTHSPRPCPWQRAQTQCACCPATAWAAWSRKIGCRWCWGLRVGGGVRARGGGARVLARQSRVCACGNGGRCLHCRVRPSSIEKLVGGAKCAWPRSSQHQPRTLRWPWARPWVWRGAEVGPHPHLRPSTTGPRAAPKQVVTRAHLRWPSTQCPTGRAAGCTGTHPQIRRPRWTRRQCRRLAV
jgi:hypothetical protein